MYFQYRQNTVKIPSTSQHHGTSQLRDFLVETKISSPHAMNIISDTLVQSHIRIRKKGYFPFKKKKKKNIYIYINCSKFYSA